ncbi:peptide deformylase [Nocardia puris]|uniref:Peptide deformylase n=2 Tax=Nocardia puris TaxID=208602 RepID=A0A366CZ43_9NOCA|nr:peptide deformylase [Nocardia puris]
MLASMASHDRPLLDLVSELLATDGPLPIVQAGDPVLRRPAAHFDGQLDDALLARLITAMRETMHAAPGVGLAAPQVGIPLRVAVLEDAAQVSEEVRAARAREPLPFRVLVNPVYSPASAERAAFFEGCLSVSGWEAVVTRPADIHLTALDETGHRVDEFVHGWPARIVQHETDHLDGTLYLDRADLRSLSTNDAVTTRWHHPTPHEAAIALLFPLPH